MSPLKLYQYLYTYFLKNKRSILVFLIAGTLAALVNLASFNLFWGQWGINYAYAVSMSYFLSVLVHFITNRKFAFQRHDIHIKHQMPKYILLLFLNYLITLGMTHIAVDILHILPYWGILFSIMITVNTSYLIMRYWVFR